MRGRNSAAYFSSCPIALLSLNPMRYLLCLLMFFFLLQPVQPQLPAVVNTTVYNENNGIANGKVLALLQGTNGYLWLGTTNGLLRFDGYQFRLFSDKAILNSITRLAEDSSHRIWMSFVGGGLACFNPADGKFSNYSVHNDTDPSLPTAEVEMLYFDRKGQLWLSLTQKGLIKADIDNDRFTQYNLIDPKTSNYSPAFQKVYNTVYKLAEDADDRLWLATHDGLYYLDEAQQRLKQVTHPSYNTNGKPRYDLFGTIYADKEVLWMGAWAGGLSKYNRKTNEWNTWQPSTQPGNPVTSNLITGLVPRNEHQLWVCSPDNGIGVFDKQKEIFSFFSHNPDYRDFPVAEWWTMIRDKEDNIWALNEMGLVKLQVPEYKFSFRNLPVTRTDNRNAYGLSDWWENDRWRLIGTAYADGLHILNKRTGQQKTLALDILPKEESVMDVRKILSSSIGIIVLSRDHVYTLDTVKMSLVKELQPPPYDSLKPSNSLTNATEDRDGNIWITTKRNGVFVYNKKNRQYTHYSLNETGAHHIGANFLQAAATDGKGRVWLGGPYGYLAYAENGIIHEFNNINGNGLVLPGKQTYLLYADRKGDIWASTFYGLVKIDCSGAQPQMKKIWKASDGLRSNIVKGLCEDERGNMWCVTEVAVSMIRASDGRILSYDATDGITTGKIGEGIVNAGADSMRVLSFGGYYNFSNKEEKQVVKPVPVMITGMRVNDEEYWRNESQGDKEIVLRADQNTFSFEFAAISFNRPGKQRYLYMLEGFDRNWIDAGSRRFVTYTNLQGGHYVFKVKAADDEKQFVSEPISVPLFIGTPYYKTIWFFTAIVLLMAAILYWLYRNRLRHHRQVHALQSKAQLLEKEKALVMYDALKQQLNPHFLFNSLGSLSSLIQQDQELADNFLEQLSAVYRYILKNRDKETVTLDEELKFVQRYIQLQQTRFREGLKVEIQVDDEYRSARLTPVVLQNLVENAIKHNITDPTSPLTIKIYTDNDQLIVTNNLQKKGFVETSNKQGLQNLRTLYAYYTSRPIEITETTESFTIKLPLL
jgi:ligand-binding sensor domain-containing protein